MHTTSDPEDYRRSHLAKGADYDADLAAAPFDKYMADLEAQLLVDVADRLFPDGMRVYLDFACGTGRITSLLEDRAQFSYGVDVSTTMLAEARRKCRKANLVARDITREAPPIDNVDLITSFRFFGNAQDELRTEVLAVLFRVLRPGGYLVINNHRNSLSLRHFLLSASRQPNDGGLSYFQLRRLLRTAGFRLVETHGIGTWVFRAALKRTDVLQSPLAERLERWTRRRFLAAIAPDVVTVARRPLTQADR